MSKRKPKPRPKAESGLLPTVFEVLPAEDREFIKQAAEGRLLSLEEFLALAHLAASKRAAQAAVGLTRSFRPVAANDRWTRWMMKSEVHGPIRDAFVDARGSGASMKPVSANQTEFWRDRIIGRVDFRENAKDRRFSLNAEHLLEEFEDIEAAAELIARMV